MQSASARRSRAEIGLVWAGDGPRSRRRFSFLTAAWHLCLDVLYTKRSYKLPRKEDGMKKITAFAGLLLIASLAAAQTAKFMSGPLDEALAQAKKENKLVLIDFFSSG
jgi:hypothetical protein